MFALLFALTFAVVSSQNTCNFPLTGQSSCSVSPNTLNSGNGNFIVTFIDDMRFPSCLDIHITESSSSNYEFTYDLNDQYTLQLLGNNNLLVTVISGCGITTSDSALYKPSVFLSLALYALCVLLGFPATMKRSLFLIGILALLPIAFMCTPNPTVLTIGVPSSIINSGNNRIEVHTGGNPVSVFVDNTTLAQCNCGSNCVAVIACGSGSQLDSTTCTCSATQCPTGCATCSSSTVCLTCNAGFVLSGSSCISQSQCPTNCLTCSNSNTCISCMSGFTLSGGQCILRCPTGCSACSSANVCTACATGFVLSGSTCVSQGTCPNGCQTCSSSSVCTACMSGYSLVGSECFLLCSPSCNSTFHCVQGQCVGSGSLFFSIAWQFAGDGDIYVTDPLGNTINWVQPAIDGGLLDVSDSTGRGPENVFWPSNPPAGTYRLCIDDFSGDTPTFTIPQTVTFWINTTTSPQTKVITAPVTDLFTSSSTPPNACTTSSNGYLGSITV